MSKLQAVLLLAVGLAVGLWLGFNPKAHQATVQDWNRASTAMMQVQTGSGAKIAAVPPRSSSVKPTPQPAVSASAAWRAVSAVAEEFWSSLQRLWQTASARIGTTR